MIKLLNVAFLKIANFVSVSGMSILKLCQIFGKEFPKERRKPKSKIDQWHRSQNRSVSRNSFNFFFKLKLKPEKFWVGLNSELRKSKEGSTMHRCFRNLNFLRMSPSVFSDLQHSNKHGVRQERENPLIKRDKKACFK